MTAALQVLKPGPRTLIQDRGRIGHFRSGVTIGGPMDQLSFEWANRLAGNPPGTAALEIALGPVSLQATHDITVALTGADAPVHRNGVPMECWRGLHLQAGDTLDIGRLSGGVYLYLAVFGGLAVPQTLGSSASVLREQLGGLKPGEPIRAGDRIPVSGPGKGRRFVLPPTRRPRTDDSPLRLVPGYQYRELHSQTRCLLRQPWTLSAHSDRMGYRLEGDPIPCKPQPMLSEGLTAGAIQLPPAGLPIIMMRDHQTIGGYPKLGTLIGQDQWRLAQYPPGTVIHLRPVTPGTAVRLAAAMRREFERTCPIPLD